MLLASMQVVFFSELAKLTKSEIIPEAVDSCPAPEPAT